jgi:hypothetical protein
MKRLVERLVIGTLNPQGVLINPVQLFALIGVATQPDHAK